MIATTSALQKGISFSACNLQSDSNNQELAFPQNKTQKEANSSNQI